MREQKARGTLTGAWSPGHPGAVLMLEVADAEAAARVLAGFPAGRGGPDQHRGHPAAAHRPVRPGRALPRPGRTGPSRLPEGVTRQRKSVPLSPPAGPARVQCPARPRQDPASTPTRGSRSSQRGRYQFRSPSRAMAAGSSTLRITVASISTATASPTPACLRSSEASVPNRAKTHTMTSGGGGDDAGGTAQRLPDRLPGRLAAGHRLLDAAEDEHVVVHGQAEQDHEQEQRQPGGDRCRRSGSAGPARPSGAGRPAPARRTRRPPTADSAPGAVSGTITRPEHDQQQAEGQHEHERDRIRQAVADLAGEVDVLSGCPGHEGLGAGDVPDGLGDERMAQRLDRQAAGRVGAVTGQRKARARRRCGRCSR